MLLLVLLQAHGDTSDRDARQLSQALLGQQQLLKEHQHIL